MAAIVFAVHEYPVLVQVIEPDVPAGIPLMVYVPFAAEVVVYDPSAMVADATAVVPSESYTVPEIANVIRPSKISRLRQGVGI
jgi:hypothetical protein